jgi:hypothetical protein
LHLNQRREGDQSGCAPGGEAEQVGSLCKHCARLYFLF